MFGRGAAGVDWEELLRRNPCLTSRLTLDETPLADFLGAVWQLDSGEYCAHLARLKLEGAHLRSPTCANSSSLSGRCASQGGESFEMGVACTSSVVRHSAGGAAPEAVRAAPRAKDAEVLREHVSRVEWDGVVEHDEGEDDDETGKVEPKFDLDGHSHDRELCTGVPPVV